LTVQKNAFLAGAGAARDYVAKPIQVPRSPYEIKAGTVIPAALVTGINSDLPGEIVAQVTENVFDTATGHYLLVPQGSRLVGKYDSLMSYGQNRALVVWNRLILPNGDSIDLEGMPGSDQTGAAGLEDETNHHRWQFAGALAVSTLLSLGPSIAEAIAQNGHNGADTNVYTAPATALGSNTSIVGENLLNRELNRPNTITVRPGWPLNVLINRDLVMRSYTNG
jgi:type IV secretion system protein VirB10